MDIAGTALSPNSESKIDAKQQPIVRVLWFAVLLFTLFVYSWAAIRFYDAFHPIPDYITETFAAFGLSPQIFPLTLVISDGITVGIFWLIAIIIFARRADNPIVFAVSIALIVVPTTVFSSINLSHYSEIISSPFIFVDNVLYVFANNILVLMIYTLPDGKFKPRWLAGLFFSSIVYIILFYVSAKYWNPSFRLVSRIVVFLVPAVVVQLYRYRHNSDALQRQQTKWVVFGIVIAGVGYFLYDIVKALFPILAGETSQSILYQMIGNPLRGLFVLAVPIGFGFAALRYRLWAIDFTVNRTIVYGLMSATLIFLFTVNFFIFHALIAAIVPALSDVIAAGLAALINVLAFNPTHRRIRQLIDRRLYGFRFDLYELRMAHHDSDTITNRGFFTGKIIEGYQLTNVIGRGGMGEVYEAANDNSSVAIKTLSAHLIADPDSRLRFEREAQATKALNHPNIVRVHSSGYSEGIAYMILEYLCGQDLRDLIRDDSNISIEDSIEILRGIASALDYAHKHGIIHRDLKPSNIMLSLENDKETYHPILMDFGLARITDVSTSLTGTGAIGTIDYMAPEQIVESHTVGTAADIYALGVIAYEMLCGQKPYSGHPGQILFSHIQQPVPDIRVLNPGIPSHIATAVQKAMAKDATARFATALEFIAALESGPIAA